MKSKDIFKPCSCSLSQIAILSKILTKTVKSKLNSTIYYEWMHILWSTGSSGNSLEILCFLDFFWISMLGNVSILRGHTIFLEAFKAAQTVLIASALDTVRFWLEYFVHKNHQNLRTKKIYIRLYVIIFQYLTQNYICK